jgi:ribose-phosphate pyrophosphokinase
MQAGARQVSACASHAVLSGAAIERISNSALTEVVVTNTIPLTEEGRKEPKIKVLTIAGLVARAIQSIHEESSVSRLFA